jgi:hypothetical protein
MQESYYKNKVSGHNGEPTCKNHIKSRTDPFGVIPMGDYSLKIVE